MAPQTVRRTAHADASTKEHRSGTTVKNPKFRPHKRSSIRPKCFRSVRPAEMSDFQFVTQNTTTRKVSIEELQHANEEEGPFNWSCFETLSPSSASPCVETTTSSSVQPVVSPATSPRLIPRSVSCTLASMKRRAPSMCLVGLLAHQTEKRNNSALVTPHGSEDSIGSSSGVWGHFVELQEEREPTSSNDSPRHRQQRRPILRGPSEELEGFFLTVPDIDEAVDQLRNMSF